MALFTDAEVELLHTAIMFLEQHLSPPFPVSRGGILSKDLPGVDPPRPEAKHAFSCPEPLEVLLSLLSRSPGPYLVAGHALLELAHRYIEPAANMRKFISLPSAPPEFKE